MSEALTNRPLVSLWTQLLDLVGVCALQRALAPLQRDAERSLQVRDLARALARACRNSGQDVRSSPLWPLTSSTAKYIFDDEYERRRKVILGTLTPRALFEGLCRGNHLQWNGWKIRAGGTREVTGDHRQPAWEARIWVQSPLGTLRMFSDISRITAHSIYTHIAGGTYTGNCTLADYAPTNLIQYSTPEAITLALDGAWSWQSEELEHWLPYGHITLPMNSEQWKEKIIQVQHRFWFRFAYSDEFDFT
jgi:hypothetical protein